MWVAGSVVYLIVFNRFIYIFPTPGAGNFLWSVLDKPLWRHYCALQQLLHRNTERIDECQI
jgi:hypothetical protein